MSLKDKDKGLRSEDKDKDLSVYATAGNLFATKIKNNVRAVKH